MHSKFNIEYAEKNGQYAWYYDRGMVTKRDENGEALVVSGIVFDISKDKQMQSELIELNQQLATLAITDELTGIYNRRYMSEKLDRKIARSIQLNTCFSLIMIDLDHFKEINDTHGHNMGDSVLKEISQIIKQRIRKTDTFSRWGGDEFIILLPGTQVSDAVKVAEDIRVELEQLRIQSIDPTTVSIGVADNAGCSCVDSAIQKVDQLMYQAKHAGRNSVYY